MYFSYCGIRVADLDRSLDFYTRLFGLKEVGRGDNTDRGGGLYVLLRDERSGLKLELNWYPPDSTYGGPYLPGEGLDHLAFRVKDVDEALARLAGEGVEAVPIAASLADLGSGVKVAYVRDPDGNWIELYHNPAPIDTVGPKY